MNTKILALMGLLAVSGLEISSASACSVLPVNATAQKNDLVAQALSDLGISIEDINDVDVADYSGAYIWTPMCPKGLTSRATFSIAFSDPSQGGEGVCTAVVGVSKTFLYEDGVPEYEIELVQAPACLA